MCEFVFTARSDSVKHSDITCRKGLRMISGPVLSKSGVQINFTFAPQHLPLQKGGTQNHCVPRNRTHEEFRFLIKMFEKGNQFNLIVINNLFPTRGIKLAICIIACTHDSTIFSQCKGGTISS